MIICSQCGGHYGCKTWHAGAHNDKKIWRCANKYEGKKTGCKTPHVVDADIEHAFVDALARRIAGNAGARRALRILEETVFDTRPLEAERDKVTQESGEITDKQTRLAQVRATADYLDARPPLEYSDDAWALLVGHVTIETYGQINVVFKGLPVE